MCKIKDTWISAFDISWLLSSTMSYNKASNVSAIVLKRFFHYDEKD